MQPASVIVAEFTGEEDAEPPGGFRQPREAMISSRKHDSMRILKAKLHKRNEVSQKGLPYKYSHYQNTNNVPRPEFAHAFTSCPHLIRNRPSPRRASQISGLSLADVVVVDSAWSEIKPWGVPRSHMMNLTRSTSTDMYVSLNREGQMVGCSYREDDCN